MDEQLAQLLANTVLPQEGPRTQAEETLKQLRANPDFPLSLARIGLHASAPVEIRQAALTYLRKFIEGSWSPDGSDNDGRPPILIPDIVKDELRPIMLALVLNSEEERKIKLAASYCVSKIAMVDFPDRWPSLLPDILSVMPNGSDAQVHGALHVLQDLVEETLSGTQFFSMAQDIINACYIVSLDEKRKQTHRALAVLVFRGCFDIMDQVKDDHRLEVTAFAEQILNLWLPFFKQVIQSRLPDLTGTEAQPDSWYGPVALKTQVLKTLVKIKLVFPILLLPDSPTFFQLTWAELATLQDAYRNLFVLSDAQGRLEDMDGLPYTLDFLILDALDFLNICLRASPVQKYLEADLSTRQAHDCSWLLDLMKLLVTYSHITQEEEGLWDIDVSLYLAEETSISSNYTARTACGDLLIKLGEWINDRALHGLYAYTKTLFAAQISDWRSQEAALYLFNTILVDFQEMEKAILPDLSQAYTALVEYSISRPDEPMLRARGFLVASRLCRNYGRAGIFLDRAIESITRDSSELVQVACLKAVEGFVQAGDNPICQLPVLMAVQHFLEARDLSEIEDADDLLVTLLDTLRAAIQLDHRIAIQADTKAIDLLFLVAKHGASNYQVTTIVCEAFEDMVTSLADTASYTALCARVLPTLTGAWDAAGGAFDSPLVTMAIELLVVLVEHGSEPLPAGFVASTLPQLNRLLMTSTEGDVLRPGASAVRYMLMHDHVQVFGWHDDKITGLEVCLRIIDRLLGPDIEDNAASEVGGLAAELVEKAGAERLGPYLRTLLEAVAVRLATAEAATLIQNLILVFARLSISSAQDVINFLADIQVTGQTGLQAVLSKWLEHSINFAGYDEIRQNVIALSKIFLLNDGRIAQTRVKGDLVVTNSNQIMTRSRARLNPDQYTIIPAPLKMVKVLIEELLSASGVQGAANAAAAAVNEFADVDDDDGDEGWEDDATGTLDLALGSTKNDLMNCMDGASSLRQKDDETQSYLLDFFRQAASTASFTECYSLLDANEREKLKRLMEP